MKKEAGVKFKIYKVLFHCFDNLTVYLLQNHKKRLYYQEIGFFQLKSRVGISMMMSRQESRFQFRFYNNRGTRRLSCWLPSSDVVKSHIS